MSCNIPSNPDIAGIGVRVAIYAQNFFSFIPAIWALWDGEVSEYELESVETQATTILVTAFAILITAMSLVNNVGGNGLSNFDAAIILNLSWMNNTNTFIWFLLYVQHKSQPDPKGQVQVKPTLSAWINHIFGKIWRRIHYISGNSRQGHVIDADREAQMHNLNRDDERPNTNAKDTVKSIWSTVVLCLGSLHLTLMACLGIWLWQNAGGFGKASTTCTIDSASIVVLGAKVQFNSHVLQHFSLAFYALFLAPGLNLLLPACLFLGIFICYHTWYQKRITARNSRLSFYFSRSWTRRTRKFSILPIVIGMLILAIINIIFMIDTELTLHWNQALQSTDSELTFGQILALLLLVIPIRDLAENIVARREKRSHTAALRIALIAGAHIDVILSLVEQGADPNVIIHGMSSQYRVVFLLMND